MKEAKPFVIDPKVMSMHKELSVKSRVRGDFHARFCERVRVKLPRSTRPMTHEKRGNRKDKTGKQSVKTEKSDFSAVKSHFFHS